MEDAKIDLTKPHISREQIQQLLSGMKPRNLDNYRLALVHKSLYNHINYNIKKKIPICSYLFNDDEPATNERLEFLGDAVFNLIVGGYLFEKYPDKDEGFLTRLRTKIVRGTHCVKFSKLVGIHNFVLTGSIVKKDHTGAVNNDKLLEDAFEAFLGAIYLDLGYTFAKAFIYDLIDKYVDINLLHHDDNYKDILMRFTQTKGLKLPEYRIIKHDGHPHKKIFSIQVVILIDGKEYCMGIGKSSNKKEAEQKAAMITLENIDESELKNLAGRDYA